MSTTDGTSVTTDTTPLRYVTYEDVETKYVEFVARKVYSQYWRYLVTHDDLRQEIFVYLYSEKGQKDVNRWLNHDPQQTSRIRFTFQDKAKAYAERLKAQKLGYDIDDIHWYSTNQILALMPLALDQDYDGTGPLDYERAGNSAEQPRTKKDPALTGDIQAMVMDVRCAITALDNWVELSLVTSEPGESLYDSAVEAVVQYLGGPRPFTGRRKVTTNSAAQAKTGSEYSG